MTKEQWDSLGKLWNAIETPGYENFINALAGTEIILDTMPESVVFYGALKRLSVKDQIQVNSNVTIVRNPAITKLLVEWLKVSNAIGDSAVKEVKEIINKDGF